MSLPIIIGASVAGLVGLGLAGLAFKKRNGLKEAIIDPINFYNATKAVSNLNEGNRIKKTFHRQPSENSNHSENEDLFRPSEENRRSVYSNRSSLGKGKRKRTRKHSSRKNK